MTVVRTRLGLWAELLFKVGVLFALIGNVVNDHIVNKRFEVHAEVLRDHKEAIDAHHRMIHNLAETLENVNKLLKQHQQPNDRKDL